MDWIEWFPEVLYHLNYSDQNLLFHWELIWIQNRSWDFWKRKGMINIAIHGSSSMVQGWFQCSRSNLCLSHLQFYPVITGEFLNTEMLMTLVKHRSSVAHWAEAWIIHLWVCNIISSSSFSCFMSSFMWNLSFFFFNSNLDNRYRILE